MTRAQANQLSDAILTAGFDHRRRITTTGHTLKIPNQRLEAAQLQALLAAIAPGGVVVPGLFWDSDGITIE